MLSQNHSRASCRLRFHPDFNKEGPWSGSSVERTIRVWDKQPEVRLPLTQRADGSSWSGSAEAPNPKKKNKDKSKDKNYYGNSRGNNDGDRRGNDGGDKGGSGRVHFDDRSNRGTPCRTDIVTHLTCNCGGSDINSTYRQCLVSLAKLSTYFTAFTLFDTGAYTSFVNREVATWLELRQEGNEEGQRDRRRFSRHDIPTSVVGLAGMTMNSSIYGSVVFDLTLFNEVTRTDYILRDIRASVIDSCIEVIVGLPDIRSHRLIHIIPSYFDTPDPTYLEPQTPSQGHDPTVSRDSATLSLLAPSRKPTQSNTARCRGAAACDKCSPFIAMGYDHTLCSLAGRPHTPQRRETGRHPIIRE